MISEKARAITSPFKYRKDLKTGMNAEMLFYSCFSKLTHKGDTQSQYSHIDFSFDDMVGNIDVKGLKESHKKGFILLEMMNVQGKTGWCHKKSKADFFAFQFPSGFYVVNKKDILIFLESVLPEWEAPDRTRSNKAREEILYKYCGRSGRKDVFTYIRVEDLIHVPHLFIPTHERMD